MSPELRLEIFETWKQVQKAWIPAEDGNRFTILSPNTKTDLVFTHDFLGRVYCEGLYISTFPKLRKIASNGN